jgi:hypothetical protein
MSIVTLVGLMPAIGTTEGKDHVQKENPWQILEIKAVKMSAGTAARISHCLV